MEGDCGHIISYFIGVIGALFSVLTYIRLCRKPKAHLRFSNGNKEITLSPHYCREIGHKYYVGPLTDSYDASVYEGLLEKYNKILKIENEFVLMFRLANVGKLQLENYHVEIGFDKGIESINRADISDDVTFTKGKPQIKYSPVSKYSLNQDNSCEFGFIIVPDPEVERIEFHWRINAKDFSKEGKLYVNLESKVDEYVAIHFANSKRDIPKGEEEIEDLMPYIEDLQKKVYIKG